jgi:hypothetical protein
VVWAIADDAIKAIAAVPASLSARTVRPLKETRFGRDLPLY